MKPKIPQQTKPLMSKQDAGFHVAHAGANAQRQAEAQGMPPEAVDALMETQPLSIKGITLEPLSLATTWALESVGSAFVSEEGADPKRMDTRDLAIAILCFADPVNTRRLARRNQTEEIEEKAAEVCAKITFIDMHTINQWMEEQFARVRALSGEEAAPAEDAPGKPSPEPVATLEP